MTTYTSISNALVAVGAKPFATTIQALRDNTLAIAEADASVAASLLPTVLLGTLATTSGTSVTLSSLVLTPYKFLKVVFRAVGTSDAASNLQIAGDECSAPLGNAGNRFHGTAEIDLSDGTWSAAIGVNAGATGSASGTCYGGNSGYTTATTSVTFAIDVGSFDAGSILVYGCK